jgi:hypothetical protein
LLSNWRLYATQVLADTVKATATSPLQTEIIQNELGEDYYNKLSEIQEKKAFLYSSPYRYIVNQGGEDIYPSSLTYKYIGRIDTYIKDIVSGKAEIGLDGISQRENNEYCNWYVKYLVDILYMNKHRLDFGKEMNNAYREIERKYKYR